MAITFHLSSYNFYYILNSIFISLFAVINWVSSIVSFANLATVAAQQCWLNFRWRTNNVKWIRNVVTMTATGCRRRKRINGVSPKWPLAKAVTASFSRLLIAAWISAVLKLLTTRPRPSTSGQWRSPGSPSPNRVRNVAPAPSRFVEPQNALLVRRTSILFAHRQNASIVHQTNTGKACFSSGVR